MKANKQREECWDMKQKVLDRQPASLSSFLARTSRLYLWMLYPVGPGGFH